MKLKTSDYIKVFDLPSYNKEIKPTLPVITKVVGISDSNMITVNIDGVSFELYEDDGYELIKGCSDEA